MEGTVRLWARLMDQAICGHFLDHFYLQLPSLQQLVCNFNICHNGLKQCCKKILNLALVFLIGESFLFSLVDYFFIVFCLVLGIDIKRHPAVLPLLSPLGRSLSLQVLLDPVEVLVKLSMIRLCFLIVPFNT